MGEHRAPRNVLSQGSRCLWSPIQELCSAHLSPQGFPVTTGLLDAEGAGNPPEKGGGKCFQEDLGSDDVGHLGSPPPRRTHLGDRPPPGSWQPHSYAGMGGKGSLQGRRGPGGPLLGTELRPGLGGQQLDDGAAHRNDKQSGARARSRERLTQARFIGLSLTKCIYNKT